MMSVTKKKERTAKLLRAWGNKKWWHVWVKRTDGGGVVSNLYNHCDISYKLVRDYCSEWDEFSGDIHFPVPGSIKLCQPQFKNWTGTYGAARKRFCIYLADVVESMPDEEFEKYIL